MRLCVFVYSSMCVFVRVSVYMYMCLCVCVCDFMCVSERVFFSA